MSELDKLVERVYEKYSRDNDIWLLLQEVVRMRQDLDKYIELSEDMKRNWGALFLARAIEKIEDERIANAVQEVYETW